MRSVCLQDELFELCTPLNEVIVKQNDSHITLLGIRHKTTGAWVHSTITQRMNMFDSKIVKVTRMNELSYDSLHDPIAGVNDTTMDNLSEEEYL